MWQDLDKIIEEIEKKRRQSIEEKLEKDRQLEEEEKKRKRKIKLKRKDRSKHNKRS